MSMNYEQAKSHARHYAVVANCDYGIMPHVFHGYMAFPLPPPEQRSGSELLCEVVRLADITRNERIRIRWLDDKYGDNWRDHGDKPIPPDAWPSHDYDTMDGRVEEDE